MALILVKKIVTSHDCSRKQTSFLVKNHYLCIVFFMVLDLRLTKIGTQRSPFFFLVTFKKCYFFRSPYCLSPAFAYLCKQIKQQTIKTQNDGI